MEDNLGNPLEMYLGDNDKVGYDDRDKFPNGIGIPACMSYPDAWDLLVGDSVTSVTVGWEDFRLWDSDKEELPEHDTTKLSVWPGSADGLWED
eukprot:CAMPEP_0202849624 /NCGR_PEP_ID=MMETSP1389-20130828/81279_1 /ASSEMBLY_ACC=CAM_ASM_000865 /TAXON_ID=302021 /ORGANISM="Rhodomonas sp., Strain CCMP768" /LENGTH=92 /DNA_ID=CAMNT_0049527671 /DNA_START=10 /DNA_END=285 /DNA_ORIENTATION=-